MKLEIGMVIEAKVEEFDHIRAYLTYKDLKGVIYIEDLAHLLMPRLEAYVTADNLLKVQIVHIREPSKDYPLSFFASRLQIEPVPLRKAVGYWEEYPPTEEGPKLPHPKILVDPSWYSQEHNKIIDYLNSGWLHTRWRGGSFCRFECGEKDMGNKCLTDGEWIWGEWIWPEGLVHYIEKHRIRLPEAFIDTMRRRQWNAQNYYEGPHQVPRGEHDFSYWINWSNRFKIDS